MCFKLYHLKFTETHAQGMLESAIFRTKLAVCTQCEQIKIDLEFNWCVVHILLLAVGRIQKGGPYFLCKMALLQFWKIENVDICCSITHWLSMKISTAWTRWCQLQSSFQMICIFRLRPGWYIAGTRVSGVSRTAQQLLIVEE